MKTNEKNTPVEFSSPSSHWTQAALVLYSHRSPRVGLNTSIALQWEASVIQRGR